MTEKKEKRKNCNVVYLQRRESGIKTPRLVERVHKEFGAKFKDCWVRHRTPKGPGV